MIKDKTLLQLIGEVIDKLKDVRYFNKLNLIWRYKICNIILNPNPRSSQ